MPPRALLIGSGYGGLPVDASVDRVAAWLLASAFEPDEILRLTGAAATRDEILRGLAHLAAHSHDDRPVVVYYAGHGYLYRTGGDADGFEHRATPLIVPIGLRRTAAGIHYGLLGSEFSAALQTIAARARNLSVILDCCHAGAMLHLDLEPDLPRTPTDTLTEPTDLTPELGPADACLPATTPTTPPLQSPPPRPPPAPHVVLLTASSAGGRAYVDPSTNRLIFTDALLAALARAPTWDAALADARGRVQTIFPAQQPGLFGPRFRRPLTLHEQIPDGELFRVELDAEGNLVLQAGAARDLHECDEFDLLDLATTTYGPGDILATARPTALRVDRCHLLTAPLPAPRRNCYARRSHRGHPPAIDLRPLADTDLHALLLEQLPSLGLAPADAAARPLAGRIERLGDELHVRDHHGELVHTDTLAAPNLDALRRCLRRLDRWLGLSRWLRADSSARPLRRYYGLEWTPIFADNPSAAATPRLRPGDRLTLAIHNLDRGESELHVQALRVRPDRSVFAWSGCSEALDARQRHDLSLPLDDPGDALPPGDYREWTFVAVANHPFEIHDLVTPTSMLTPHDFLTGRHLIRRGLPRGDAEREAIDLLAFPYLFTR